MLRSSVIKNKLGTNIHETPGRNRTRIGRIGRIKADFISKIIRLYPPDPCNPRSISFPVFQLCDYHRLLPGAACLIFIACSLACEQAPSMRANNAGAPLPVAENAERLTPVERELRDMETANFKIIYVIKRRDGGVFDKEDKRYLSDNKPADVNRFILTDDEKAFVAGSNFPFSLESLEALQKRFIVEDHSKPLAQTEVRANDNANANTNANAGVKANTNINANTNVITNRRKQ
jgi:hypothetical protein